MGWSREYSPMTSPVVIWGKNISGWEKNRRKGPEQEDTRCVKGSAKRPASLERKMGQEGEKSGETGRFLTTQSLRDQSKDTGFYPESAGKQLGRSKAQEWQNQTCTLSNSLCQWPLKNYLTLRFPDGHRSNGNRGTFQHPGNGNATAWWQATAFLTA